MKIPLNKDHIELLDDETDNYNYELLRYIINRKLQIYLTYGINRRGKTLIGPITLDKSDIYGIILEYM